MYTEDNTAGYDRADLDALNLAHDIAWGAYKHWTQVHDRHENTDDVRVSLSEFILTAFDNGERDVDAVATAALTRLGFKVTDTDFGLKVE